MGRARSGHPDGPPALAFHHVWHELRDGPILLRAIDLELGPGECVALMGRNGAGKSTLLRHAKGLLRPTRGRVASAGRVALLLQNPGDYLVHDRVADEAEAGVLEAAGFAAGDDRHPRDLSGGERQRLALALATGPGSPTEGGGSAPEGLGPPPEGLGPPPEGLGPPPETICLDEPTRGMDRALKDALAARLRALSGEGRLVLVATHDVEFAATFAARVVLLAEGVVIADGPASEVLSGGWYFAPETARILRGAGGVLLPEDGAALLRERAARAEPEVVA